MCDLNLVCTEGNLYILLSLALTTLFIYGLAKG
jgi:hypothetical protein